MDQVQSMYGLLSDLKLLQVVLQMVLKIITRIFISTPGIIHYGTQKPKQRDNCLAWTEQVLRQESIMLQLCIPRLQYKRLSHSLNIKE